MSSLKKFDYRIKDNRKRNIFLCGIVLVIITIVGVKLFNSYASFSNETEALNLASGSVVIPATYYLKELAKTNENLIDDETEDHNIRYIGATPDNYVDIEDGTYENDLYYGYRSETNHYFRQEYTSLEACKAGIEGKSEGKKNNVDCTLVHKKGDSILWRIIGVMNNVEGENGKTETRIKLIRDESLGKFRWDYKQNGVGSSTNDNGSNDWSDSQLMMMLNPEDVVKANWTDKKITYNINEDGTVTDGNHTIYKEAGSYFNRTTGFKPASATINSFTEEPIDFSNTGLSEASKKYIGKTKYYLGGMTYAEYSKATTEEWYSKERSNSTYNNNPTTWTGYIGLMYPSDYGFGTSGAEGIVATEQEEIKERAACLLDPLYKWRAGQTGSSDNWYGCRDNSWLYEQGQYQWFISPSDYVHHAMRLRANGHVNEDAAYFDWSSVRPVLYLKSNIKIVSGAGTKDNPFKLSL